MTKKLLLAMLLGLLSLTAYLPVLQAANVTIELVPSSRVILKVISGMTIDDIIERIYPKDKDLWPQIKAKLIETNPNSFYANSDQLISGTRLKLVDIKRIYEEELIPKTKVGFVADLKGKASARDVNGKVELLQINSQIFEGDRIRTEVGSNLSLLMDDGAEMHLKEDSVLKISEYAITSGFGEDSSSILDLLRGGLRKITGAIGTNAVANYRVQTGFASIGIRGTEYVIMLCHQDDCSQTAGRNDPNAKLHAAVLDGAITLTTEDDVQILIASGEYGTATPETVTLEQQEPVPSGFLDAEESHKFNVAIPQQQEAQESSDAWKWILGLLLLAAGI